MHKGLKGRLKSLHLTGVVPISLLTIFKDLTGEELEYRKQFSVLKVRIGREKLRHVRKGLFNQLDPVDLSREIPVSEILRFFLWQKANACLVVRWHRASGVTERKEESSKKERKIGIDDFF